MAPKRKRQHMNKPAEEVEGSSSKQGKPRPAKKKVVTQDIPQHQEPDLSRSVLGGLKDPTLNSRVSGDEPMQDDLISHFKIPFGDKVIVCEHHNRTNSTSSSTSDPPSLIFTHGAGGGIANPATRSFAAGFSTVSSATCFQGTMNLTNRVKTFHATIEHCKATSATSLGGRSMGARAAVLTALESNEENTTNALILVSYPLMAGGKGEKREPERREKILTDLPEGVDVLFVAGENDAQCPLDALQTLREKMKARSWLLEVKGADHGMSIKAKKGVEAIRERSGALAAEWLKERAPDKRYCSIEWDAGSEDVSSSGWTGSGGLAGAEEKAPPGKRRKKG